jgi:hypothetical protein
MAADMCGLKALYTSPIRDFFVSSDNTPCRDIWKDGTEIGISENHSLREKY